MTGKDLQKWGGTAALVGGTLFVVVVITLQQIQPAYRPRDQLMSELALGEHGWAMFLAFLGLAVAAIGIQVGIAAFGSSLAYRLLLIAAAMFFLSAGIFPLGDTTTLHVGAIGMAFVLSVLAIYLFPACAGRASAAGPRAVSWPLALGVATSVAFGQTGMPIGVAQRLSAGCLLLWFWITGLRLLRS